MAVDNIARGMAASALKNQGGGGVSKASELDNDVPFVSASDSQTLTEDQQKKAQENIGIGGLVVSEGGDTLTWDGNTEGLVNAENLFYKLSDATPTLDDFSNGGSVKIKNPEMEVVQEFTLSDVESMVTDGLLCPFGVACVRPEQVGVVFDGVVFPEPGTYFSRTPDGSQVLSLTIPGYTGFAKKKIKTEYIPDSVPNIQTAAVGQTIVVSEVDENGKPTKWEAAEFPAGSGGAENVLESVVDTLTWDGKTDGLVFVETPKGNYCKVSDVVLEMGDLINGVEFALPNGEVHAPPDYAIRLVVEGFISIGGLCISITKEGGASADDITFPEQGLYFLAGPEFQVSSIRVAGFTGFPGVAGVKSECIRDMYYEELEKMDISGLSFNDIALNVDYVGEHGHTIPFALGQVWRVDHSGGSYNHVELEVKQSEDGVLYIGDMDAMDPPFCISATHSLTNYSFNNAVRPIAYTVTCVSGYYTRRLIHPIRPKYLPKVPFVPDVTSAPTMHDFNNLLAALRDAGYMET